VPSQFRHRAYIGWIIGVLLVALAGSSYGEDLGAGDAAHFLRDGIGARPQGMGSAFVALADDVTTSYWNPAGLIQTASLRIGGTYESRFGGLSEFQYLAGALNSSIMGGGFLWAHSDIYSVYIVSGAVGLSELALGITGKLYSFSAPAQRARGVGIDVGGLYRASLGKVNLTLGITSADIGWSEILWQGQGYAARDYVAWVTRLGTTVSSPAPFGSWRIAADLEIALRRPPRQGESNYLAAVLQSDLRLGTEVWLKWIAVRAGLADIGLEEGGGLSVRMTLGLGVQMGGIAFDAAWTPSQLGNTYLLSIEVYL